MNGKEALVQKKILHRDKAVPHLWNLLLKEPELPVLMDPQYRSGLGGEMCIYRHGTLADGNDSTPHIYRILMEDTQKNLPKMKVYFLIVRILKSPVPNTIANALEVLGFDPSEKEALTFQKIKETYLIFQDYINIVNDGRPETLKARGKIEAAFLLLQKNFLA